tara:strand:- start:334 stop:675 length:342 start_codon:yes stop_codon:yes gene_type:complete
MPADRFVEGVCGCCARREIGHGVGVGRSTIWLCDDPDCLEIAKRTAVMKQDRFSDIESLAAQDGGNEGLWFLEEIGKTDLTTLTIDEVCEFKRRVVAGYRNALKNNLRREAGL